MFTETKILQQKRKAQWKIWKQHSTDHTGRRAGRHGRGKQREAWDVDTPIPKFCEQRAEKARRWGDDQLNKFTFLSVQKKATPKRMTLTFQTSRHQEMTLGREKASYGGLGLRTSYPLDDTFGRQRTRKTSPRHPAATRRAQSGSAMTWRAERPSRCRLNGNRPREDRDGTWGVAGSGSVPV